MTGYRFMFRNETFIRSPKRFVEAVMSHSPELTRRYENSPELSFKYSEKSGTPGKERKLYSSLADRMERELSPEGWDISIEPYGLAEQKAERDAFHAKVEEIENKEPPFDPKNINDGREKTYGYIAKRRGGKKFRDTLLKAYGGLCAITKCDVKHALEACHIIPYKGPDTNDVTNGLLLRADIHTLFDLRLIAIHEDAWKVLIAPSLKGTTYEVLANNCIKLPAKESDWPNKGVLKLHREEAGL